MVTKYYIDNQLIELEFTETNILGAMNILSDKYIQITANPPDLAYLSVDLYRSMIKNEFSYALGIVPSGLNCITAFGTILIRPFLWAPISPVFYVCCSKDKNAIDRSLIDQQFEDIVLNGENP